MKKIIQNKTNIYAINKKGNKKTIYKKISIALPQSLPEFLGLQ
jgi:hypothetical protein